MSCNAAKIPGLFQKLEEAYKSPLNGQYNEPAGEGATLKEAYQRWIVKGSDLPLQCAFLNPKCLPLSLLKLAQDPRFVNDVLRTNPNAMSESVSKHGLTIQNYIKRHSGVLYDEAQKTWIPCNVASFHKSVKYNSRTYTTGLEELKPRPSYCVIQLYSFQRKLNPSPHTAIDSKKGICLLSEDEHSLRVIKFMLVGDAYHCQEHIPLSLHIRLELPPGSKIAALASKLDKKEIIVATTDAGGLLRCDAYEIMGKMRRNFFEIAERGHIHSMAASGDRLILCISDLQQKNYSLKVWDIREGKKESLVVELPMGLPGPVQSIDIHPHNINECLLLLNTGKIMIFSHNNTSPFFQASFPTELYPVNLHKPSRKSALSQGPCAAGDQAYRDTFLAVYTQHCPGQIITAHRDGKIRSWRFVSKQNLILDNIFETQLEILALTASVEIKPYVKVDILSTSGIRRFVYRL